MSNSSHFIAKKIRKLRKIWEKREKQLENRIKKNRTYRKSTMFRFLFAQIKRDSLNIMRQHSQSISEEKMKMFMSRLRMELKEAKDVLEILDSELITLRREKISLGLSIEKQLSEILLLATSGKNKKGNGIVIIPPSGPHFLL